MNFTVEYQNIINILVNSFMDSSKTHFVDDVLRILSDLPETEKLEVLQAVGLRIRADWVATSQLTAPVSARLKLPDRAPKFYKNRPKGQNIIDFLRDPEGWGPYVAAGVLSRPDLGRLDPPAYKAVSKWILARPWPDEVKLPKKSEATDSTVSQLGENMVKVARAVHALRMRGHRQNKPKGPTG